MQWLANAKLCERGRTRVTEDSVLNRIMQSGGLIVPCTYVGTFREKSEYNVAVALESLHQTRYYTCRHGKLTKQIRPASDNPRPYVKGAGAGERHYNSDMAAGDAQRVWFPEMIERLRSQWHHGMSFHAVIELRDDLDAMLQLIRSERHIHRPVFRCQKCGYVGEGAEPHVSVRAMILSLTRFGIAPAEPTHALEKDWAAYRKQKGLDPSGKRIVSPPTQAACCTHS